MSTEPVLQSPLPPPRRIITYHNTTGEYVTLEDTVPIISAARGQAFAAKLLTQADYPAKLGNMEKYAQHQETLGSSVGQGINALFIDLKPGHSGGLHFIPCLEYVIVIHGEIDLVSPHGGVSRILPGEFVASAGSVHAWRNPTDQWARLFCVRSSSEPVITEDGKSLKDLYPDVHGINPQAQPQPQQ